MQLYVCLGSREMKTNGLDNSGFACGLSQIAIPYSVTKLGEYAFSRCSSLKEIYLPSTLLTVESAAINGCANLERVDCEPESRPSG